VYAGLFGGPAISCLSDKVRKSRFMKRVVLLAFALGPLAAVSFGQRARSLEFKGYPATVERTAAKAIDFKASPGASTFRTRLRDALEEGVNFAGHFILTGWGCGTGCTNGAVIDARNGRVYFPDELAGVGGYDEPDGKTFTFQKNSRLLIICGTPGPDREDVPARKHGTYYYEWRSNRFRLIKFVPDDENASNV